jgi:hypothetical protein
LPREAARFSYRRFIAVNFNALFDDKSADGDKTSLCPVLRSGSDATDSKLLKIGKRRALPDQQELSGSARRLPSIDLCESLSIRRFHFTVSDKSSLRSPHSALLPLNAGVKRRRSRPP